MAARRFDDLVTDVQQFLAEVLGGSDAICEIILVHDLFKSLSHGFEVTPRQTPIRDKSLREDEQRTRPFCECVVAEQQHATDIDETVLLGTDRSAIHKIEHLADDGPYRFVLVARFAELDEICILREATRIEEHRDGILVTDRANLT